MTPFQIELIVLDSD